MKGIICYYSGSGNTKLACEYIKRNIKNADFELHNIVKDGIPDFCNYHIVGFATFADFAAPPLLMYHFVEKLDKQNGKSAFVFNTFGMASRTTLTELAKLVTSAGFKVHTGFSFHTPENYPPMRKLGLAFDKSPKEKDIIKLDAFISDLDNIILDIDTNKPIKQRKLKKDFLGKIFPPHKRETAKKDFGIQKVNISKCTECGVCAKGCPYGAISMNPKPEFNHKLCAGCWYCYNNCKRQAIFTKKFKGEYQYSKPSELLMKKLA